MNIRRANLAIYDVKAQPNEYTRDHATKMLLKNRRGEVVGVCLVDNADFDIVINRKHIWFKKKRANGQPYVINQAGLLLAHLLLGVDQGIVDYKNKNPLDNRRENLKIVARVAKAKNLPTR